MKQQAREDLFKFLFEVECDEQRYDRAQEVCWVLATQHPAVLIAAIRGIRARGGV